MIPIKKIIEENIRSQFVYENTGSLMLQEKIVELFRLMLFSWYKETHTHSCCNKYSPCSSHRTQNRLLPSKIIYFLLLIQVTKTAFSSQTFRDQIHGQDRQPCSSDVSGRTKPNTRCPVLSCPLLSPPVYLLSRPQHPENTNHHRPHQKCHISHINVTHSFCEGSYLDSCILAKLIFFFLVQLGFYCLPLGQVIDESQHQNKSKLFNSSSSKKNPKQKQAKLEGGGLVSTPHSDWMDDLADTGASRQASL